MVHYNRGASFQVVVISQIKEPEFYKNTDTILE